MWAEIFRRAVDENGTPSIHDPWPAKDVSWENVQESLKLC
jgi:chitin synthase